MTATRLTLALCGAVISAGGVVAMVDGVNLGLAFVGVGVALMAAASWGTVQ
jgi:hypothetical protein